MDYGIIVQDDGFILSTYSGPAGTLPEGYTSINAETYFQIQSGYYYINGEVVPKAAS